MIFSENKWNKGAEMRRFVKINQAVSFRNMETPLRNAFQLFIIPLLGFQMCDFLIGVYDENVSVTEDRTEQQKKLDQTLLEMAQEANANLALWYDFDVLNTRITDEGFQRQESENGSFKNLYKYQEDRLRSGFKNKGFNCLDRMLDFLFLHINDYELFKESDIYKKRVSAIVRSTTEVDQVYFINSSRLVFLRLQNHFSYIEQMELIPAIGEELYEQLIAWLTNDIPDGRTKEVERLRIACMRYVVVRSVHRLLTETGSITDRGLYFDTIQPGKDGNTLVQPVDTERIAVQLRNLEVDARLYMENITRVIRDHFSDFYTGDPNSIYDRDNEHKKTFWA